MTEPTAPGPHSQHDIEVEPELANVTLEDRPDGPGAAAIVAAGLGIFALGALTTFAEISEGLKTWLGSFEFGVGVGPLAGKTTMAVAVWAVCWLVLSIAWWRKDVNIRTAFIWGVVFGVIGGVGTFPTFFEMFA